MRKITKFPKLVIDEAKNLKKFATLEELAKLNIENFNPQASRNCIYGQMTGICYSSRATTLIKTCAKRVYRPGNDNNDTLTTAKINGSPKKYSIENRYGDDLFWSPIEVSIARASSEMNTKLIAFLKGERKRLL